MNLLDFTIRNTQIYELDEFIDTLETTAEWLKANNIEQWPLGMFRDSRGSILRDIVGRRCFMIDYRPSTPNPAITDTVAGLFVLNYHDDFDRLLWDRHADDWMDALYLHRLVIKKPFQGLGLMSAIVAFAEKKVKEEGRHFLRMDCLAANSVLRRYYGEWGLGKGKGGFKELKTVWNADLHMEFARFEIPVPCETEPEELEEYINILERAAEWMESQNLAQWIPGTFRKADSRQHISDAIAAKNSYVVFHTPTKTIAAIFALNYRDPFDEMLWVPLLGPDHWQDAIYVHRLVVEKAFQGRGLVPKVLRFVEELVPQRGKTYLRLDCRGNNPGLRKYYREKCRGLVVDEADGVKKVMGLEEKGTYTNPASGINYARFERLVVKA
ncbi:hypothetical protein EC968_005362 [Mortierella alpina]|nr:hypothetical protein EC968_005362 [Mortierella alpina]